MHITDLKDKQVLITGAASGIGLATAEAFARRGARLILTDLNADHLAAAQRKIQALGAQCHTAQCDAGNWQLMQALAADIQSTHGTPDVLINNAGIAFLGGVMEHSLEHWQKIFQVNVMGVVHGVWAFLPAMRAAGGPRHIVNIASAAAVAPAPNMSAYAASKAAVRNFGEVLAMELDGSNILVQSVYPGFINTAIVSGVKSVGANISQRQLDCLQRHYQIKGCDPSVVAEDIVRGVLSGKAHVFTGPMAKLAHWLGRLSPRWLRAVVIKSSRQNGYLPSAPE